MKGYNTKHNYVLSIASNSACKGFCRNIASLPDETDPDYDSQY